MRVNRKSFEPDEDKFFKTVLGVWILGVFLTVAFWGALIFVAIHFLAKVW